LINQPLGIGILIVPSVVFAALALNVVAWALVKLAIDALLQMRDKKR
jgi:hypothetical protein